MNDKPDQTTELKKGDVISVIRIRPFQSDLNIPAIVKTVTQNAFGVQALKGDFDGEGHDLLWLEKSAKGRTWK